MASGTETGSRFRSEDTGTKADSRKHCSPQVISVRVVPSVDGKSQFPQRTERNNRYLLRVAATEATVWGLERNVSVVNLCGGECILRLSIREAKGPVLFRLHQNRAPGTERIYAESFAAFHAFHINGDNL